MKVMVVWFVLLSKAKKELSHSVLPAGCDSSLS